MIGVYEKNHNEWGNYVVCQNTINKSLFYVLAHLNTIYVIKDELIYPGKVIGTVGNTGKCYTTIDGISYDIRKNPSLKAQGRGRHLHLQLVYFENGEKANIVNEFGLINKSINSDSRNPFKHGVKYQGA